ncbi:hypothetical protein [Nostoc sp. LEGE 12450]|uniref:hypothetical protein n=1 Tax=Nostoc sp. LEGE 12450 TaxID=1828643 RepID=UPI001D146636|nr:hypothetical protein [Nostoc sp. LEGE 12450]
MSDIADFSASQLLSLYRDRQLSPVAATKAALERINTYNSSVNAFATVCLLAYKLSLQNIKIYWYCKQLKLMKVFFLS